MKSDKQTGSSLEPMEGTLAFKEHWKASEKPKQLSKAGLILFSKDHFGWCEEWLPKGKWVKQEVAIQEDLAFVRNMIGDLGQIGSGGD